MADERRDEFFVGYLPTPPATGRFLRALAVLLLILIGIAGIVIAAKQRNPGDAVWDTTRATEIEGVIQVDPYPMLVTAAPDGKPRSLLLVMEGKSGVREAVLELNGMAVRATGYPLQRKSMSMLELVRNPELLHSSVPSAPSDASNLKDLVVRGEIIDPKCYLGAMKPGDGKTHKACATLCIRGGIPPMLITPDPASADGFVSYLLVDSEGRAFSGRSLDALLPFVGDMVHVSGKTEQRGDMRVLRIDPSALRRT